MVNTANTPVKTNMEPENDGFEKNISSLRRQFLSSMINFGVVVTMVIVVASTLEG